MQMIIEGVDKMNDRIASHQIQQDAQAFSLSKFVLSSFSAANRSMAVKKAVKKAAFKRDAESRDLTLRAQMVCGCATWSQDPPLDTALH